MCATPHLTDGAGLMKLQGEPFLEPAVTTATAIHAAVGTVHIVIIAVTVMRPDSRPPSVVEGAQARCPAL